MLYCDAGGKVYAAIINRSIYELARDSASRMERSRRPYATLGLETSPGKYIPTAVEISAKEVWALEHILEHALKKGSIPDILKKYLKPIIKLDEASREVFISEHGKRRHRARTETTPRVLNRLPYYSERDMEISIPIYKAEHSYPLVVLKLLPPDGRTSDTTRSLLILDSDGDLAVIKTPLELIDKVAKGLKEPNRSGNKNTYLIISQCPEGLALNYLTVSQSQRKALDTITGYFEETGYGKRPISAAARSVLDRARDEVAFPSQ